MNRLFLCLIMTEKFSIRILFLHLLFILADNKPATADENPGNTYSFFGSVRPVFTAQDIRMRGGEYAGTSAFNMRVQAGASRILHPAWKIQTRFAARLASDQGDLRFILRRHTGGGGSYPAGTVTMDELFIDWQAAENTQITFGRFQGRYALSGFIPKGLDRYYAANLSISHTDGIRIKQNLNPDFRLHVIASLNSPSGTSHAARSPLTFSEVESRGSLLFNLEHRNTSGLWVQREISVSVLPQSFRKSSEFRTYTAITTRAMVRVPHFFSQGEVHFGGEAGLVPNAPSPSNAGFSVDQSRMLIPGAAVGWQVAAYANEIVSNHRLGFLYGQTEPGWLVSSSFNPNRTMAEVRYRYIFSSRLIFEMRYRFQTDLFKPDDADLTMQIRDFYTRFTLRF